MLLNSIVHYKEKKIFECWSVCNCYCKLIPTVKTLKKTREHWTTIHDSARYLNEAYLQLNLKPRSERLLKLTINSEAVYYKVLVIYLC